MDTQYSPTLDSDEFMPPFDEIVKELVENGHAICNMLREHMQSQWKHRLLEIVIVDNPELNAYATADGDADRVYIFRGAVEHLYGTVLGLLCLPDFLPQIGNSASESIPENLPLGGFPPIPLRRSPGVTSDGRIFLPRDGRRITLACELVELALEFLIYHEIGHILGGHLEILQDLGYRATISESAYRNTQQNAQKLRHVLECDADAFAAFFTGEAQFHDRVAATLRDVIAPEWQSTDFALLTYLTSIGILFRLFDPGIRTRIQKWESSHPDPAVRVSLVAATILARGVFRGTFDENTVSDLVERSIGNLEEIWTGLLIRNHNDVNVDDWMQSHDEASDDLFQAYGEAQALLDQHARIPRRWDNWQWPKSNATPSR